MRKLLFILFLSAGLFRTAYAQTPVIPVYQAGQEGYKSYRIPAIIALRNNDLLAFAEGRVNDASDFGHVNIVMKKSHDGGRSWSPLQVVAANDTLQAGNPAPVLDLTDPAYPQGRIFLFYNTGNAPEGEIRKGKGSREVWYRTSIDGGTTWSPPVNITRQVKRSGWRSYANTPGHAMQFTAGGYKGRILVAANHSEGDPQPGFTDYRAHTFYTDDHGKSFHLSETISVAGSNEATAAALYSGQLMMNMRNQHGDPKCRIVAISSNGGSHWDTTYFDYQLPDPVCEGSLLNIGYKHHQAILAFCNNNDTVRRQKLTLRVSFNGGKSWKKSYLIDKEGVSTAYSDIVKTAKRKVGILYERNGYKQIVFTEIKWKK